MKRCEKCGREFSDDSRFCPECGVELTPIVEAPVAPVETPVAPVVEAPVETPAAPVEAPVVETPVETPAETPVETPAAEAPEKTSFADKIKGLNKNVKIAIIAVAAVILLAIIGLVVKNVIAGSKTGVNRNAINFVEGEDNKVYVYNGKGQKMKLFDDDYYQVCGYNMDETMAIVRDTDNNYWAVTIKSKKQIVKETRADIVLSASGNGAAVITDEEGGVGTLTLYNIKTGDAKKIAEDVIANSVIISPDGKTVAFSGEYKSSDGSYKLCVSVNGKSPKEITKYGTPYAVSDKGTYTYYVKYDTNKGEYDFYVIKNLKERNEQKLAKDTRNPYLYLNKTMSEAFYSYDGKTYLSRNGKEGQKIGSNSFGGALISEALGGIEIENRFTSCIYCNVKTFKGLMFSMGGEICALKAYKGDNAYEKVIGKYDYIAVSADGKSILYIRDNKVSKIPNVAKPDKKKELVTISDDYDIDSWYVMPDLSGFYFRDDDKLFYSNLKGKPKKIAEDVSGVAIDNEKKGVYYYVDYESGEKNTLYFSKNGSKKKVALKDVVGTTRGNGGYYIAKKESKKDDAYYDYYFMNGTSAKKALTTVR